MASKRKENEEDLIKYELFKKKLENQNELKKSIMELYRIESKEIFPEILVLPRLNYLSQLKTRVNLLLMDLYSSKILCDNKFLELMVDCSKEYEKKYNILMDELCDGWENYKKNKIQSDEKSKESSFYITDFRKHCGKTGMYAVHNCGRSIGLGFFIAIFDNQNRMNKGENRYISTSKIKEKIKYVVCENCHKSYFIDFFDNYCEFCKESYYCSPLHPSENQNLFPATFSNPHCETLINEKIKCDKCGSLLYLNIKNNKLQCLNNKCKNEKMADVIQQKCNVCKSTFNSGIKIFNPVEDSRLTSIIDKILVLQKRAYPARLPCCKTINIKNTDFYHRKNCKGILYLGENNDKLIIVCDKCKAVNFYSRFIWTCPCCGLHFKDKYSEENEMKIKKSKSLTKYGQLNSLMDLTDERRININKHSLAEILQRRKGNNGFQNSYLITEANQRNDNKIGLGHALTGLNNQLNGCEEDMFEVQRKEIQKEIKKNNIKSKKKAIHYNQNSTSRRKRYIIDRFIGSQLKPQIRVNRHINSEKRESEEYCKNPNIDINESYKVDEYYYGNKVKSIINDRENSKTLEEEGDKLIRVNNRLNKYNMATVTDSIYIHNKNEDSSHMEVKSLKYDRDKNNWLRKQNRVLNMQKIKNETQIEEDIQSKEGRTSYAENNWKNKNEKEIPEKVMPRYLYYKNRKGSAAPEGERTNEIPNSFNRKIIKEFPSSKNPITPEIKIVKNTPVRLKNFNSKNEQQVLKFNKNYKIYNQIEGENNNRPQQKIRNSKKIIDYRKEEENKNREENNENHVGSQKESCKSKETTKESKYSKNNKNSEKSQFTNDNGTLEERNAEENCNKVKNIPKRNQYFAKYKKVSNFENKDNSSKIDNNISVISSKNAPEIEDVSGKESRSEVNTRKKSEKNTNIQPLSNKPDDVIEPWLIDKNEDLTIEDDKIKNDTNLYREIQKQMKKVLNRGRLPRFNMNKYSICKQIGDGTFGVIYEVENNDTKRKYAVKKIVGNNMEAIEIFQKEFEIVHYNNHPNILDIHGIFLKCLDITTYVLFVLMDLAQHDLEVEIINRTKKKKYFTEKELFTLLKQMASALVYLQRNRNVAHRDIKPENILLFGNETYKLCDFGEAKEKVKGKKQKTVRGTKHYMSPLLYDGLTRDEDYIDHNPYKSDVFSLGYVLIVAAALDFEFVVELRGIEEESKIRDILQKHFNFRYTDKFMDLVVKMTNNEEKKRMDFIGLEKYIENNAL